MLLDEPVASLDPLARREFRQTLIGGVAETGTTVLLSSHLLADLERICDFLIVLNDGSVQLAGEVDDLVADHRQLVGPRDGGDHIPGIAAVVRAATPTVNRHCWYGSTVPSPTPPGRCTTSASRT